MRRASHDDTYAYLATHTTPTLHHSDVPILVTLGCLGPSRPGILAGELSMSPSHMSKVITRLVRTGLVRRSTDPCDARATLVVPTSAGEGAINALLGAARNIINEILAAWTCKDVAQLTELVSRLADRSDTYRIACRAGDGARLASRSP
ncbi:MarR family winged helix-turn-helix transcriptional regulator [Klugiella xanthotipulae]|nr:MarR family transcriptional regulator [Klugiella xanthotipulae]